MHLIFIGAPGSGKGTQADRLRKNDGYYHVSTGDLLRSEVAKASSLGLRIKELIDNGQLVDDSTVLDLFSSNLMLDKHKYILDGFPRTINQCNLLADKLLHDQPFKAVYFEVDEGKIVERIVNRRVAPKSGKIYNLIFDPPEVDGVCDISGEKLIHRDDDKEEVVKNRLKIYRESIAEILDFYSKLSKLHRVDASESPDLVYDQIQKLLK